MNFSPEIFYGVGALALLVALAFLVFRDRSSRDPLAEDYRTPERDDRAA